MTSLKSSKHPSWALNTVVPIFLFKDKNLPHSHLQYLLWLPDHITFFFENGKFFIYPMPRDCSACGIMPYTTWTIGSIQQEHTEQHLFLAESMQPFSTATNFGAITYIPHEIVLARVMTALDLELEKSFHYHDERYKSDNDYELPAQVMRPVHIYSVLTPEVSTKLITSKHNFPFCLSCQDEQGMTCPSTEGSAGT